MGTVEGAADGLIVGVLVVGTTEGLTDRLIVGFPVGSRVGR